MTDYKFHVLTIDGITILAKVFLSKKAIANNVCFPSPAKVKKEIKQHHLWVLDRRMYKPGDMITLYWTGSLFVEKSEYDGRIDNLSKRWLKIQHEREAKAKAQAERDAAKATVQDVLNFVRESRRNNGGSNVNANVKAGLTTSESTEPLDRCEGVK